MRLDIHTTMMEVAYVLSQRGTCARRRVGCVLTDKYNHILATGYNGVAAGLPHCTEVPCPGARCDSGTGLELCQAIHAEQNALLQCQDVHSIVTCYSTTAPCITCVKLLMNTSCRYIYCVEDYPHAEEAKKLWLHSKNGAGWIVLSRPRVNIGPSVI